MIATDITATWIDQILHASGHLAHATVVDARPRPLGTGQMSDSFRVELSYDVDDAGPATLIAKLPAADETSRTTAKLLRSYEKEVRFYQELAPDLEVRVPQAFHAEIDVETAGFVLLLEDLHPAVQGDQLAGCSPAVAASALHQLVALHAPRWGDARLADIEWLAGDEEAGRAIGRGLLPMLWAGFLDRYGDVLEASVVDAGSWLFTHLDVHLEPGSSPLTLVHGDYRLDNLLIIDGPEPEVVGIVDWQTCARGPAMRDVAYVIGAGLLPEIRRANEEALVRRHHGELLDAGVPDFSWEQCWDDYRRGTWAGLVMAVGASMLVERTDRGDEMFLAMASRHAQHAHDLEATELGTPS